MSRDSKASAVAVIVPIISLCSPLLGQGYERACYRADIPLGQHAVQGIATILDERTIRVDHFTYDGTAPAVYFYLGTENTNAAFTAGIPIGPELTRAYSDESLTIQLPTNQTLDGYTAISVWCVQFAVNFSSASFVSPTYPRACQQATIPPGAHDAQGVATILDEHRILIESFTYDGTAPLVYFYLGQSDTQSAFENGIPIGPELDRAYSDESLTVELPETASLDGWGAISVWCVEFNANFSSASFEKAAADFDIDGDVDGADLDSFSACVTGAAVPISDPLCNDKDLDLDNDVDQTDFGIYQICFSGEDTPAELTCGQ